MSVDQNFLNKWPDHLALFQNTLLLSTYGLSTDKTQALLRDYHNALAQSSVGLIISHQQDPHMFIRIGEDAFDLYEPVEGGPLSLRQRPYRLAKNRKLEAIIYLKPFELSALKIYANHIKGQEKLILGEKPHSSTGPDGSLKVDYQVKGYKTVGSLDNNQFIDQNDRHNCLTWITLAPIGANGETFFSLIGGSEQDMALEVHSYTKAFSEFCLSGRVLTNRILLNYQAGIPLHEMKRVVQAEGFFYDLVNLLPSA